jgi:heme A synthase
MAMAYGDKEWWEARDRHRRRMDRIHAVAFVLVIIVLGLKLYNAVSNCPLTWQNMTTNACPK